MKRKLKRTIAALSAITILSSTTVTTIPDNVSRHFAGITASAAQSSGWWSFDDNGTLTITTDRGTTAWKNSISNRASIKNVIIADGVTSIDDSAFYNCSSLESIEIPNSVTSIGNNAFGECSNLTSITIPNSVTSIGSSAFYNCSSLESIEISNSVTFIGSYAFEKCNSLTSITIPGSMQSIGYCAFGHSGFESVIISDGVQSIGDSAFSYCTSLTSITIPNSVQSIGDNAFACCTRLTSITIPNSVQSIGNGAFHYCSSLTSITIPYSVKSIGESAFDSCRTLDTIIYPNSLDVSSANIPNTATHVKYTVDGDNMTITDIIFGEDKTKVELPEAINGKTVVHTHIGGTANCTQKAVCEMCGNEYGEFLHNYVDGKCTDCGVFENGIGERLEGYSLSLDGNIGVNFYMELDESVIADETSYMQFTLPNGEMPKVKVSEAVQQEVNGNTYYVFSCEVAAKEMFDKITAQIITSGKNGEVYEYSVEEYIQYIRENSSEFDEKTIRLVDAMAEYGDYTKAYFNNEKVNASPEMDAVTADTLAEFEKQTSGELPESIAYYGSSLLLESNTTMRHYFKVANGIDVSAYGFTEKDGYYYKEITGISADKLGTAQSVTVDGYTVSYSPLSYAYAVLKSDSTDESLKNLVKALYLYEQAAEAYKN